MFTGSRINNEVNLPLPITRGPHQGLRRGGPLSDHWETKGLDGKNDSSHFDKGREERQYKALNKSLSVTDGYRKTLVWRRYGGLRGGDL